MPQAVVIDPGQQPLPSRIGSELTQTLKSGLFGPLMIRRTVAPELLEVEVVVVDADRHGAARDGPWISR